MLIVVSSKPIHWNKKEISREEVLSLRTPPPVEGESYTVSYAVIPDTKQGDSLEMYNQRTILQEGEVVQLTRPLFFWAQNAADREAS